jgi:hypothetical protein
MAGLVGRRDWDDDVIVPSHATLCVVAVGANDPPLGLISLMFRPLMMIKRGIPPPRERVPHGYEPAPSWDWTRVRCRA